MIKIDIYRSFEQWKNGNVLEHGVPRTEYYSEAQLDLVEMGWKYGYDAGLAEQPAQQEPVAWSVTWDGVHCGNFYFREQDAKDHKVRLDAKRPGEKREIVPLYTTPQPPAQPLPPEWYARWIRNNYQDHPNITTLCDEMTKAAHGITKGNT